MKTLLSTPLKELDFPPYVGNFWNDNLINKFKKSYDGYSFFSRDNNFPTWEKLMSSEQRVFELLKHLSDFNSKEKHQFKHENIKDLSSSYLSVQMLNLLSKEGLDITKVLLDNHFNDIDNKGGWSYTDLFEIYLKHLDSKNESIPNSLLTKFIFDIKEEKKYASYRSVDEEIDTYFKLLKIIPQNKINYNWFSENLNLFCTIKDEETRELVNYSKHLNYDSQKQIYDYVNQHFPEKIIENKEYYLNLLSSDIFSTKRLYQGSVDINIFQLIHQCKLSQNDSSHLSNIAKHCLSVIASPEFMQLINENIAISNIHTQDNQSNLTLNFSTDSYENLEIFEKIVLRSLNGVMRVSEKIKITWSESYSGADELITNMDAKFIHQYYLYNTLSETLETNTPKPRKNKI